MDIRDEHILINLFVINKLTDSKELQKAISQSQSTENNRERDWGAFEDDFFLKCICEFNDPEDHLKLLSS